MTIVKTDATTLDKPAALAAPSKLSDILVLAKVRLNALVVLTSAGGFYMAGGEGAGALSIATIGTALVACGAAAMNQVAERDTDRLMARTRNRPLAAGRMTAREGQAIGAALAGTGALMLWFGANPLAAAVAVATLLIYVAIYTPMKRWTSLSTVVGAVPGALPPIIGWAAARDSIAGVAPWSLFLIMFCWQMPHFLAIAWMFRDDYARAGMPMLAVIDRDGGLTGRQAALWAGTLVPVSLLPFLFGAARMPYALAALALGAAHLAPAVGFAIRRSPARARRLFYASIVYLPLLWATLAIARP
ncbi:MAG: protoheme IX farnesyltransferase [Acidobacteria bacterium]|nr:protoheme IX farnesyltransferase [Acidobacteriota bacterium]